MLRDLRLSRYAPTLAIRPAEMRGLEELSEGDKSTIFPMVLLAPWVGSATLEKSIERVRKAYGDRPFFLDLDRDFQSSNAANDAHREFFQLQAGNNHFALWREFIEQHDGVIPVIQHRSQGQASLLEQLAWAEGLGRGFAFRFAEPGEGIGGEAHAAITQVQHAEFGLFLDSGWSANSNVHEMWFRNAAVALNNDHAGVPIVLSSSDFPKDFAAFRGVQPREIGARTVFNAVRQSLNQPQLIYGDWASTKSRSYDRSGSPLPRIDYARRENWVIARNKEEGWGYQIAAQRLMASPLWRPNVATWGANMIERTALDDQFAIDSVAKNVAARVNLHLHVQANFDAGDGPIDTDDPWEDT